MKQLNRLITVEVVGVPIRKIAKIRLLLIAATTLSLLSFGYAVNARQGYGSCSDTLFSGWNCQIPIYVKRYQTPLRKVNISITGAFRGRSNNFVTIIFAPYNRKLPTLTTVDRPFIARNFVWTGQVPTEGRFLFYGVSLQDGGFALIPYENLGNGDITIKLNIDSHGNFHIAK
jgi:hypothetical protein